MLQIVGGSVEEILSCIDFIGAGVLATMFGVVLPFAFFRLALVHQQEYLVDFKHYITATVIAVKSIATGEVSAVASSSCTRLCRGGVIEVP